MRRTIPAALAVLCLHAPAAHAQKDFEGVITMKLSGATPQGVQSQEMQYLIRGRKMRLNMVGVSAMSVVISQAEQKMYMIMDAQKAYAEMPIGDAATRVQQNTPLPAADVKVTRTGRTEKIAGTSCEHVTVVSGKESLDMCVAKGLGTYISPLSALRNGAEPAWQKQLAGEGFPLKVTGADGTVAMEVTKIERKRLDNTLFSVPESYTKMTPPPRR